MLDKHSRYVSCCSFSQDGDYLASGSNDKTICIWKLSFTYGSTDSDDVDTESAEIGNSSLIRVYNQTPLSLNIPPSDWVVNDVCHWLVNLGMYTCVQHAKEKYVDGQTLLSAGDEEILQMLHIGK